MSMSVRQKQLTKKVMCSLLAAGVINVCISVGDAWAADYEKTAGESKVIDNADGSKSVVDFGTGVIPGRRIAVKQYGLAVKAAVGL